ncbi:MAG TPA: hypothetical protein VFQ92_12435, partial [Blastocatellia bacterium]|nr:hypothetical protein [Blastocatellia bacterium]
MAADSLDRLLSQLEESKRHFDQGERTFKLLVQLGRRRFKDAESLIRFHEALLFVRAHPQTARVLRQADQLLETFAARVESLDAAGLDLTPFDYIESSGIAGTVIRGTFSFRIARWLRDRYPSSVDVDWDRYEKRERLANALPRIIPLMYEDTLVEANIPYLEWLDAGRGRRRRDLGRIIDGFERMGLSERERAELYDLLELPVRWELGELAASRSLNKRKVKRTFYQKGPFIRRSEVSLADELRSPIELKPMSARAGAAIL